ncbi:ABC transporter substrate-binding protein [Mangrovicoccus sp. HB161399]|uniref:ABC transporter substrate-binding protein n=1 Tax=Mangrovicoccus sp. HB161399 TaxID=2720392 RepID=UPI0015555E83|nr:ABC transporter substrate-binding protein [Mangrovicoccus sp. HB161399]
MQISKTAVAAAMVAAAWTGAAAAEGRDVTIVLNEEVDVMEPCMVGRQNISRIISQNITERLTEYNYRDGGIMPRLATSWEQVDEDTWRFHLRDGVKFHDGGDFTAEDVIFSIQRNQNPNLPCEVGAKFFGGIDFSFETPDPHTLEITTSPPSPILPLLMAVMPVESRAATPENEFTRAPVGTGPYVFDSWDVGKSIKLARNPDYWGEQPIVESASYVFRADSAVAAAMVQAGEADIVPSIAIQDATDPETDFSYPNSETTRIRINTLEPPLDDRRVREALNLAIDREAMIGTLFSEDVQIATQLVVPTTMGYNKDIEPFPYDPDRARALLAEAKADGVPVDMPIHMIGRVNQFANATEAMEAIAAMLREVGFNIDLQMNDVSVWNTYFVKPFPDDDGPSLTQAQHDNAMGDPVFTAYVKYHSDGAHSMVSDPELDTAIEKATAATGAEREALWQKVFARANDEIIADIMLFHMVGYTRVSPRLAFTPTIATNLELQLSQIGFND